MKVALDNKNGRVGSTAKERFAQAHHASRNLSAVALCNNNFFRVWMGARHHLYAGDNPHRPSAALHLHQ